MRLRRRRAPRDEAEVERAQRRYLMDEVDADELDREVGVALRVLEWGWTCPPPPAEGGDAD